MDLHAGLQLLDQGDAAAALPLLERAVEVEPDNPAPPVFLALGCADAGDPGRARKLLLEALRRTRENRVARGFLALVSFREGNPAQALRTLEKAGLEPSRRLIGRLLVEVEKVLRPLEAAEAVAARAEAGMAPAGPVAAPIELVEAPTRPVESPAPAVEDAAPPRTLLDQVRAILVDPVVAQSLAGRAEQALMRERWEDAVRLAEQAVARFPGVPRGWCMLGVGYLHLHRYEDALRSLQAAADHDGETPDVLYARGCCLHEMGRLAEAGTTLEQMLRGFEKDAAARYTLGQIALEEGDELAARGHFEQAAALDFLIVRERVARLKKALADAPAYVCPGERMAEE